MDNNAMAVQGVRIALYMLSTFLTTKGFIDPTAGGALGQNMETLGGSLIGLGTVAWWLKANWKR